MAAAASEPTCSTAGPGRVPGPRPPPLRTRSEIRSRTRSEIRSSTKSGAGSASAGSSTTPVSTSADGSPAARAPAMSVSGRSPHTSVRPGTDPATFSACKKSSGLGFPTTVALRPDAASTAARMAPVPGTRPSALGYVASRFEATKGTPRRATSAARRSSSKVSFGFQPMTSASTSSTSPVGAYPRERSTCTNPGAPHTCTREPSPTPTRRRCRSTAWADVTTSPGSVGMRIRISFTAQSRGDREALFVTKMTRLPSVRSIATVSAAPGTSSSPRQTTPSRSTRKASNRSASRIYEPEASRSASYRASAPS